MYSRTADWLHPVRTSGLHIGVMPDCEPDSKAATVSQVMTSKLVERGARIRRTKWVELSCLLCGEAVATLEGGSVLRPHSAKSVRVHKARVVCGRCGGSLSPTDQGERVHFV